MRIVYICSSSIPSRTANSINVIKMCQAFTSLGHEVFLLAPDKKDIEKGIDDWAEFYGVKTSFRIIKLPWTMLKGRPYIYALSAAFKAFKLKPDLVYGRFLPGCFFSCYLGLPIIYESHGPVQESGKISLWMFQRLLHKKQFKKLVVLSNALRSYYLEKYKLTGDFISVAHNAADKPYLTKQSKPAEKIQVGYTGHLYPGKGMEIIYEMAKNCPWADFHLIGGTDEDINYWQEKFKEFDNIFFHGFLPPSETDRYRQLFDVLLAPCQRNVTVHEGKQFKQWMSPPVKIFEYMAAGKAIICSDFLAEILTHEKTALLCNPQNPQSWTRALQRLRDEEDLRKRLGEAARKDFKNNYTWTARAQKVLQGL